MKKHLYLPQPGGLHYICYPESCGHYRLEPSHREYRPPGALKEYNLHVVMSGRGFVITGGERTELSAGWGFLYAPGARQDYGTDPDDPWDIRWVHFYANGMEPMLLNKARDSREGVWIFRLSQQRGRVERALGKLLRLSETYESAKEPAISAALYEVLAAILHDAGTRARPTGGPVREKMLEIADHIREHCHLKLNLNAMAEKAGYSPWHFTRIFRDAVGKSPAQYLTECRILLAKKLLVSTRLSVKQIAYETGFGQSSYFIRQFHRMTGMTPGQFREWYG